MISIVYGVFFWRCEHTGQFNSLYLHTSLRNLTCKPTHTEQTRDLFQNSSTNSCDTSVFCRSQLDSSRSALLPQWERVFIAILPVFPRSWFNVNPAEWSRRSAAAARARASLLVTPGARPQTFTAHARRMRGSSLSVSEAMRGMER